MHSTIHFIPCETVLKNLETLPETKSMPDLQLMDKLFPDK